MTGRPLALTDRDRAILAEVGRFGVITRSQLARLGLFRSKTRANERLKKLTQAGYLTSRRQPLMQGGPRHIYGPGPKLTNSRQVAGTFAGTSDLFLTHQLGLVDIRIAFEGQSRVIRWLSDKELVGLKLGLTPDAFIEFEVAELTYCAFIEYDRGTETLGRVELKVRKYIDLAFSERFERIFGRRFFRVLLITDTPGRQMTLSRTLATVTDRILRLALLADVDHRGPLTPIWRRPGHIASQSLTDA